MTNQRDLEVWIEVFHLEHRWSVYWRVATIVSLCLVVVSIKESCSLSSLARHTHTHTHVKLIKYSSTCYTEQVNHIEFKAKVSFHKNIPVCKQKRWHSERYFNALGSVAVQEENPESLRSTGPHWSVQWTAEGPRCERTDTTSSWWPVFTLSEKTWVQNITQKYLSIKDHFSGPGKNFGFKLLQNPLNVSLQRCDRRSTISFIPAVIVLSRKNSRYRFYVQGLYYNLLFSVCFSLMEVHFLLQCSLLSKPFGETWRQRLCLKMAPPAS